MENVSLFFFTLVLLKVFVSLCVCFFEVEFFQFLILVQ